MSDSEQSVYAKRTKTIHYGSLEESDRWHVDRKDNDADGSGRTDYSQLTTADYMALDEDV